MNELGVRGPRRRLFKIGLAAAVAFVVLPYLGITVFNPRVDVPPPQRVVIGGDRAQKASVLFLGDTAPVRDVKAFVEKNGYGAPFRKTAALIGGHDVTLVNLEAPLSTSDRPSLLRPARYRYKVSPRFAAAMKSAGIDVVSLANNHAKDYFNHGLRDTLSHLDQAGVRHFGAGMSEAEARRGLILETAGGSVCWV